MARDRKSAGTRTTKPAAPPAPELPRALVWMAPLVAALVVHGNGVLGGFAADDLTFLMRVRGLEHSAWGWTRPLAGRWRWESLTALFGVQPLPHLALAWLLHAASALLVTRLVRRSGGSRFAAMSAGVLVAGSSIAYTSTHWASGLGETLAAALALAALVAHVECRRRTQPALAWAAAAAAVAAVLSKESVLLLPLAVWAFDRLLPVRGEGRGALREIALAGGAAAVAVLALWRLHPGVAGEAYAVAFDPRAWVANLATYAAWLVDLADPVRDRTALPDPSLVGPGLAVLALAAAGVWSERRNAARPVTAGLLWFGLMLAPVVPLVRHTYLYYLLVPLAGLGFALGCLSDRVSARPAARLLLALVLVALTAFEARQVRARASERGAGVLVDRVARESRMLHNVLGSLERANVPDGDTLVLINPWPLEVVDPSRGATRAGSDSVSAFGYIPLVGALHGGRALALYRPQLTVLGMGDRLRPEWERAHVFRFGNEGELDDLGRGVTALDSLATDYLRGERWAEARAALVRMIQLGADGPEVRWRLARCDASVGDEASAMAEMRTITERWPDSERGRRLRAAAPR